MNRVNLKHMEESDVIPEPRVDKNEKRKNAIFLTGVQAQKKAEQIILRSKEKDIGKIFSALLYRFK